MTLRIVTDSTCDLPQEIIEKLGITVIPLYINVEHKGYLDGVEMTRQEFYEKLPGFNPPPTTAAPGAETFKHTYEQLSTEGATQILSIHISASLSATVEIARHAAQITDIVPVHVMDGRSLTLGTGFLVEKAAHMANDGKELEEILTALEDQTLRTRVFAALDTVEFLRRSGRMSFMLAGLASLLQIKPLLKMHDGKPTSEKVRTSKAAIKRLVTLLREAAPLERVALVHSHAFEKAEALKQQVLDLLPPGDIPSVDITPVLGAHLGPGAVGFTTVSCKS